ncbi:hypothetical protein [Streptomyces sp. NPDC051567]|uniref:hypothetical protein n=1 Tax=Streptomyces sp. NPDC051567 TaxID=3365660 RepID=UPI00379BF377
MTDLDGNPVDPGGPPPGTGGHEVAAMWSVEHTGRPPVEFPATIDTIRAGLSGERLAEFRQETGRTPGHELAVLLFRWSYPPEELASDDEVFTRLASGDFTACVPQ